MTLINTDTTHEVATPELIPAVVRVLIGRGPPITPMLARTVTTLPAADACPGGCVYARNGTAGFTDLST